MNRRDFLRLGARAGLAAGLGGTAACVKPTPMSAADRQLMAGLRVLDAHAHPFQFYTSVPALDPTTPTVEAMIDAQVVCCAWAAVGDLVYRRRHGAGSAYVDTVNQLAEARSRMRRRGVRLVTKAADIPTAVAPGRPPGAILAIEGGDALEGRLANLDRFYAQGVRMMTLVHYTPNALGDIMTRSLVRGGLTALGRKVVGQMQRRGMIVDLAHADDKTVRDVLAVTSAPVVDSHTSPRPRHLSRRRTTRLRSWPAMELVAKAGGVICTWPLGYAGRGATRKTFADWAAEIRLMKKRLGMAHVGLGTDGGGRIPRLIRGYQGYRSLPRLVRAMGRVGLSRQDIEAYLGGNFLRVIKKVLG
ncbi:MAG: membrane dipeptidase [Proteobacteria bacterium]|nr:membrane dipeptidase [Pseudomonadota bacterium]